MPAGYGLDGFAHEALTWAWVEEQLTAARNYWVCTTRGNGLPHAMPVWGLWLHGAVYFSTDPESLKARNIARQPELVVHLESGDDVVVLEGTAERVTDAAVLAEFADAYDVKYNIRVEPDNPDFGFYRLQPRKVLAWRETDFPSSATRWRFEG